MGGVCAMLKLTCVRGRISELQVSSVWCVLLCVVCRLWIGTGAGRVAVSEDLSLTGSRLRRHLPCCNQDSDPLFRNPPVA